MKTVNEIKEMMRETKLRIIIFADTIETFKQLGIPDLVLEPWREKLDQSRRDYIQLVNLFNQSFANDAALNEKQSSV